MTQFEKWRETQIYEKGDTQRKAEVNLEKQQKTDFVTVQDTATGVERSVKKNVADILTLRKEVQSPRLVFTMPDLSHIDWSN